jgi:hypothetical protein
MGFSLSLLIAHPWVGTQDGTPSWYVHEVVALGRVTRLEKLVSERYRHIRFDSTTKAGICVASSIFRHLVAMLQSPQRSHFVPQFAPMVGGFSSFESGGVHPLRLWLSETCLPPIELMQKSQQVGGWGRLQTFSLRQRGVQCGTRSAPYVGRVLNSCELVKDPAEIFYYAKRPRFTRR